MPNQVDNHRLDLSIDAKPRLKWTWQLHERFVDAICQLGGADKATPKSVMRVMGVHGLTLYHLKSHLQKYRLAKNVDPKTFHENTRQADCLVDDYREGEDRPANTDNEGRTETKFNETMLQMHMEVQRKLQEQIEVQRHLQLRIEAQGNYLQSILRKAQETLAGFSSNPMEMEAAKAELSELVSAVNTERLSSSFSRDGFIPKQTQHADCSTDSCLTSSERPETKDRKPYKLESRSSPYYLSEDSDEVNPNSRKRIKTRWRSCSSIYGEACVGPPSTTGRSPFHQEEHSFVEPGELDLNR